MTRLGTSPIPNLCRLNPTLLLAEQSTIYTGGTCFGSPDQSALECLRPLRNPAAISMVDVVPSDDEVLLDGIEHAGVLVIAKFVPGLSLVARR